MSDKTVQQLADMVKTPLDQLLKQLQEAGLSARTADDVINDEQQMQLLTYLRKSHGKESQGENDNSPKEVTLEYRKVTEIKQASVPGSSTKTISGEVRIKKTYIKRPETDEQKTVEPIQDFAEQSNTPEIITAAVEIETTSPVTTEVQVEQVAPIVEETLSVIESVATPAVVEQSQPEIEAKADSNDKQNHVIPNIDLDTESESLIEPEKDSGSGAEFKALDTEEDKITTVEERAIEAVNTNDDMSNTAKPEIMPFDVNITETLSLGDLLIGQLIDTYCNTYYAQVDPIKANDTTENTINPEPIKISNMVFVATNLVHKMLTGLGFKTYCIDLQTLNPTEYVISQAFYEAHHDKTVVLAFDYTANNIASLQKSIEHLKTQSIEHYKIALPPYGMTWHDLILSQRLTPAKQENTLNNALLQGQLFFANTTQECVYFYRQQYPDSKTFIFPFKDGLYKATVEQSPKNSDSPADIRQLTDCSMLFEYSVIDETKKNKLYHHLLLYSEREGLNRIKLTDNDFTQTNLFIKALQQGRQIFYGNNKDLTELRSYLLASQPPKLRALATIGYEQDSHRYVFPEFGYALNGDKVYLDKSIFFAMQGRLSNDSYYDGIMPFMSCTDTVIKPSITELTTATDLVQFIHALKEAYGAKALLMFGFYISSLFSHVIFNKYRFFPLLSLYGFPHAYGDDKRFLTRLFNRCLFIDSEGQKIKAVFVADSELKKIRQKSNLVCALLDDRNYKKPFVYDTVLPYYNRNLADLKAPLTFVSSNDTEQFSFEVIKEFLISLHFPNTINSQVKPAWQQLNTYSPEQLASVGNYLLNNRQYFEQNLINTITQYQTYLTSNNISLKMAQNYAIALSGIVCFLKLSRTQFINTPIENTIQEDINYLEHYTLQRAGHKQQSTQNPAYLAEYFLQLVKETDLVKEGIALRENVELQFSNIEYQPDMEIDLPKVLKQLKTHDLEFNQKMLEVELKKHPHFFGLNTSMESGVTRRVFVFDVELADRMRLQFMGNRF